MMASGKSGMANGKRGMAARGTNEGEQQMASIIIHLPTLKLIIMCPQ